MRVIFVKNASQTGSDMIDMLQVIGKDKRRHVYATIHIDFFFPNTSRIYKALERGDEVECEIIEVDSN